MPISRPVGRTLPLVAALLAAAVFLASAHSAHAAGMFAPRGGIRPYAAEDHRQHPRGKKTYIEQWGYRVQLDTGHHLTINLLVTNIGIFKGVCGMNVALTKEGTAPRTWAREYDLEFFRIDEARHRIEMNKREGEIAYIEGLPPTAHALHLEIGKNGGLAIDLVFRDMVPGVIDGDFTWRFGGPKSDDEFGVAIMFPRATVTGSITIGDKKFKASGIGYGMHSMQTELATDFADSTYNLAYLGPDYSVILFRFDALKKYGGGAGGLYVVSDTKKVLWAGRTTDFAPSRPRDQRGFSVPQRFEVAAKGPSGAALTGTLDAEGNIQAYGMTDEMGDVMKKLVGALVGNPIIYRDAAKADFKLRAPDGAEAVLRGRAYHEITRM